MAGTRFIFNESSSGSHFAAHPRFSVENVLQKSPAVQIVPVWINKQVENKSNKCQVAFFLRRNFRVASLLIMRAPGQKAFFISTSFGRLSFRSSGGRWPRGTCRARINLVELFFLRSLQQLPKRFLSGTLSGEWYTFCSRRHAFNHFACALYEYHAITSHSDLIKVEFFYCDLCLRNLVFCFSGGKFISVCEKIRLPDDVTIGYIIGTYYLIIYLKIFFFKKISFFYPKLILIYFFLNWRLHLRFGLLIYFILVPFIPIIRLSNFTNNNH